MNNIKKCVLISLTFLFLFNCKKSNEKEENINNNVSHLNVYFIQKGTTSPIRTDCNFIGDQERSIEEIHYKKITSKRFIEKFLGLKTALVQSKNNKSIDSKIKVYIKYENNKKDSICFGTNHGIVIDGITMDDSEKLLNMLKDEIKYNTTFRDPFKND